MLDIKFIRENADLVKAGAEKKHIKVDIDALITLDDKRRTLLSSIESKRAQQNAANDTIAKAPQGERADLIQKMHSIKVLLQSEEEDLKKVMHEWQLLMVQVPNIPDMSVPEGESDAENKEVRVWGEKPT